MALLGFIKNRQTSQQQSVANKSQEQKPETAKEMYARQAQEKAPTPEQGERARKIGEEMRKATQHSEQRGSAPTNAPDDAGSNAAMLQKQNHQDKTQERLSPTDGTAGKTATQEKQQAQEKPTERAPRTLPRRPPSWER